MLFARRTNYKITMRTKSALLMFHKRLHAMTSISICIAQILYRQLHNVHKRLLYMHNDAFYPFKAILIFAMCAREKKKLMPYHDTLAVAQRFLPFIRLCYYFTNLQFEKEIRLYVQKQIVPTRKHTHRTA